MSVSILHTRHLLLLGVAGGELLSSLLIHVLVPAEDLHRHMCRHDKV